jgi:hypothetical protein
MACGRTRVGLSTRRAGLFADRPFPYRGVERGAYGGPHVSQRAGRVRPAEPVVDLADLGEGGVEVPGGQLGQPDLAQMWDQELLDAFDKDGNMICRPTGHDSEIPAPERYRNSPP